MLSKNYNPQVIVPAESNYRANTFPKYNTHSARVHWPTLMYGPSVRFVQDVITHFMTPLCCWGHFTVKSLHLKSADVKCNYPLHIGLRLNCQTYMIFTYHPKLLRLLFLPGTAALQPVQFAQTLFSRAYAYYHTGIWLEEDSNCIYHNTITWSILCIFFYFNLVLVESVSHNLLKCICLVGWNNEEYS